MKSRDRAPAAPRRPPASQNACAAMIDIEAAYVVDTDLLEVSAPPTPRRRLLAVLRATHAVVRMRGLCVRHRRLRLALADAVLFVRSRALPLFYQRCACDWPAQELRFGRFTLPLSTLRRVSDVDAARQEFVLHTAAGAPPRDTAYEMRVPSSADDFSRWLHALQQLVLLHAHDGADARSSPAPSCRRRDGTAEATPAHRRGGSVGGGSSSGNLAAVANWPDDFEMKTRSSDDALPLPATASGGRRASSGGGGGLVGAWHRHCKSCACAVQSLGCSIADCCRACLPPPPRPAGPAPPRTSNGMRLVLVVLLLVRAAAPPIPARASHSRARLRKFPRLRARPAPPPNPLPALTTARAPASLRFSSAIACLRRTTCGRGMAAMPPATPCPPPALGATSTASAAPSGARCASESA